MIAQVIAFAVVPSALTAQTVSWTGAAGNELWNNPGNWSGNSVPDAGSIVVLDNSALPGGYRVVLPDLPVAVRSIAIRPSAGKSIELLLPASNISNDALVLTGTGYPMLLGEGAVFRNACGISNGASIDLADSFRIENGGRYIHSTRGTHATSLLAKLSTAPGTERGIFEFDVPRASYTISVSNRTYGTLVLSSSAYGQAVNYTCSGSNPLHVRGNLELGMNVSFSVDLATAKGNIEVNGDLLQQTGTFTLGSGNGDSTVLRLGGNCQQQSGGIITSAASAFPWLECNGSVPQQFSAAGAFTGNTGLRIRNQSGVKLQHDLLLNAALDLSSGSLTTAAATLLTLGPSCILTADSLVRENYIDGPLRRRLNPGTPAALFPVGANGTQRWLELKNASGTFTAAYFPDNPASFAGQMGTGIDHISTKEYWVLQPEGPANGNVELSHSVPQSGSITEPSVLRVTQLLDAAWTDAGEMAFSGDLLTGSVTSYPLTDFSGNYFTLGSALALENPLPLESVALRVSREKGRLHFQWTCDAPDQPAAFQLMLADNGHAQPFVRTESETGRTLYTWSMPDTLSAGIAHRWRMDLIDRLGTVHTGKIALLPPQPLALPGEPVLISQGDAGPQIQLNAARAGECILLLCSASGQPVHTEQWHFNTGQNRKGLVLPVLPRGIYFLRVHFAEVGERTIRWRY